LYRTVILNKNISKPHLPLCESHLTSPSLPRLRFPNPPQITTGRIQGATDVYLSKPSANDRDEAGQQDGRRHTMTVSISIYGPTAAVGTSPAVGLLTDVCALNFMQERRGKRRLAVPTAQTVTPMPTARLSTQPFFNYFNMYSFMY
jgi:hypothetical protein